MRRREGAKSPERCSVRSYRQRLPFLIHPAFVALTNFSNSRSMYRSIFSENPLLPAREVEVRCGRRFRRPTPSMTAASTRPNGARDAERVRGRGVALTCPGPVDGSSRSARLVRRIRSHVGRSEGMSKRRSVPSFAYLSASGATLRAPDRSEVPEISSRQRLRRVRHASGALDMVTLPPQGPLTCGPQRCCGRRGPLLSGNTARTAGPTCAAAAMGAVRAAPRRGSGSNVGAK
jgi:hypothetical protein